MKTLHENLPQKLRHGLRHGLHGLMTPGDLWINKGRGQEQDDGYAWRMIYGDTYRLSQLSWMKADRQMLIGNLKYCLGRVMRVNKSC